MAEQANKTTLAAGDILTYQIEDSGMDFVDRGLFLQPGEDYIVGEDIESDWAQRFVDRGVLGLKNAPAPVQAPTPGKSDPAARHSDQEGDNTNEVISLLSNSGEVTTA